jgi:hypothetical protein
MCTARKSLVFTHKLRQTLAGTSYKMGSMTKQVGVFNTSTLELNADMMAREISNGFPVGLGV